LEQLTNKQKIFLFILAGIAIAVILVYVFTKDDSIEYASIENLYEKNVIVADEIETSIIVHIIGEVNNPGIVELMIGQRIADAIEKAGGATNEADLSRVNLAYKVEDGQKICIPSVNCEYFEDNMYITKSSGQTGINEEKEEGGSKININNASQTELEELPGIGPSTSLKIIQYRDENGKFEDIEDIKNVPGIGEAKFENIKESICVN